jgi:hypothetical protein
MPIFIFFNTKQMFRKLHLMSWPLGIPAPFFCLIASYGYNGPDELTVQ